jgi:hypothetical protein
MRTKSNALRRRRRLTKFGILGILKPMDSASPSPKTDVTRKEHDVAPPAAFSKGITRRKAIKAGVFTLAAALPIVMTMWPKEAHGQSS